MVTGPYVRICESVVLIVAVAHCELVSHNININYALNVHHQAAGTFQRNRGRLQLGSLQHSLSSVRSSNLSLPVISVFTDSVFTRLSAIRHCSQALHQPCCVLALGATLLWCLSEIYRAYTPIKRQFDRSCRHCAPLPRLLHLFLKNFRLLIFLCPTYDYVG